MTILFISYWGVDNPLSIATVIPHIKILSKFNAVERILFCSIERDKFDGSSQLPILKVTHIPLLSSRKSNVFLEKLNDFISFSKKLTTLCTEQNIDFIMCRSALAGAFGHRIFKQLNIPYSVESFEPHADYMVESGVWKKYDPRTIIQQWFEVKQKKSAAYILPVAENYKRTLLLEGIQQDRLITMPCCVNVENFTFDELQRNRIRDLLGIGYSNVVGIYVGKFGGIYYDEEAYQLYKRAFDFFGETFRLIIVSSDPGQGIHSRLAEHSIDAKKVFVQYVQHDKISHYLSASDFAFASYKLTPSKSFLSPIKFSEYWANGLPILTEDGIGDDSAIIKQEGGGIILDINKPEEAFEKLKTLLVQGREEIVRQIQPLAIKYRRMELVTEAYKKILSRVKKR